MSLDPDSSAVSLAMALRDWIATPEDHQSQDDLHDAAEAWLIGLPEGLPFGHKPGDPHHYRTECLICGQFGQLRVSLVPETFDA